VVKRYYLILSRLSLAVIILQALIFLHSGLNVGKFNQRIDQTVLDLSQKRPADPALEPLYREAGARLAQLQQHNREHQWLLKAILLGGLLHVGVCYSLYIHFLRMGFTWTKIFLHANNLFISLRLPSPAGLAWMLAYIIGTRVYKHCCVAFTVSTPCTET
jgi:hypothetical protein